MIDEPVKNSHPAEPLLGFSPIRWNRKHPLGKPRRFSTHPNTYILIHNLYDPDNAIAEIVNQIYIYIYFSPRESKYIKENAWCVCGIPCNSGGVCYVIHDHRTGRFATYTHPLSISSYYGNSSLPLNPRVLQEEQERHCRNRWDAEKERLGYIKVHA